MDVDGRADGIVEEDGAAERAGRGPSARPFGPEGHLPALASAGDIRRHAGQQIIEALRNVFFVMKGRRSAEEPPDRLVEPSADHHYSSRPICGTCRTRHKIANKETP